MTQGGWIPAFAGMTKGPFPRRSGSYTTIGVLAPSSERIAPEM